MEMETDYSPKRTSDRNGTSFTSSPCLVIMIKVLGHIYKYLLCEDPLPHSPMLPHWGLPLFHPLIEMILPSLSLALAWTSSFCCFFSSYTWHLSLEKQRHGITQLCQSQHLHTCKMDAVGVAKLMDRKELSSHLLHNRGGVRSIGYCVVILL